MSRSFFIHLLLATAVASIFVTTVLPFNLLAILAWSGLLVSAATKPNLPGKHKAVLFATCFVVFGSISLAAYLAPFKTTYSHFNELVQLPDTELSLSEIQDCARGTNDNHFPVVLSIAEADNTETTEVHFSRMRLSLADFVRTIEEQTPLRHSFAQCGNAYTILWGYPPSYYLRFRREPTQKAYAP